MTRFQSLFKKFGVENRLLETASLDWRSAPAVLPLPPETSVLVEKEREHSMRFLTGALTPKVPR